MSFKYTPLSDEDKIIFCADALRKKYWERYCDGLCRYLQDKPDEGLYEFDYKNFFINLFKSDVKNDIKYWYKNLLSANEDRLKGFKAAFEGFKSLNEKDNATIPMLFALCKMQQSIIEKLKRDQKLLRLILPRELFLNYEDYRIEGGYPDGYKRIDELNDIEKNLMSIILKEQFYYDLTPYIEEYENGELVHLYKIGSLIVESIVYVYNATLSAFKDFVSEKRFYFNPTNAFISNLFSWHFYSLPELKLIRNENPPYKYFSIFQELRDKEIKSFKESVLGKHWCDCIKVDDVESFSCYMLQHRSTISEEEELGFFRQFNKIFMIEDILRGNADKYDLEVDYSIIDNGDSYTADAEAKGEEMDETDTVNH